MNTVLYLVQYGVPTTPKIGNFLKYTRPNMSNIWDKYLRAHGGPNN
jgi:hypothetical protein